MNVPLARFLTRFPIDGDAALASTVAFEPELRMSVACHEAALETVRAEVSAGYEQRIEALLADHAAGSDAAVANARARWCAEEGAALAERFAPAFETLSGQLADQLAEVLRPLLADAVVARAREALIEALDLALSDPRHPALTLRGPADLIDAVRAARPNARGVEYAADAGAEVTLVAEGLHIETRLAGALAALRPAES